MVIGFASDGKGGLDAKEFCDMVTYFMHKLHSEKNNLAEEEERQKHKESEKDHINRLLIELCKCLFTHEK